MSRGKRREEVARLLEQRERRGLTYRELSERSGIPVQTLAWWSWKLRREAREAPAFVEVEVAGGEGCSSFEVRLPNGHVVLVGAGFDGASLRRLLEVLSSC